MENLRRAVHPNKVPDVVLLLAISSHTNTEHGNTLVSICLWCNDGCYVTPETKLAQVTAPPCTCFFVFLALPVGIFARKNKHRKTFLQ